LDGWCIEATPAGSEDGRSTLDVFRALRTGLDATSELFCVIDNPVALRYFAASGRHLFALGPNATPGQVLAALKRDLSTLPITCSVYRLAAWRNHWHFGVSPVVQLVVVKHLYSTGWCSDPAFNVGS
jgi:hypothetical protein